MVVGTPGGSTIITSVLQTILNVYEFKMNIKKAVSSSRFHHQWLPDIVEFEPGGFSQNLTPDFIDISEISIHEEVDLRDFSVEFNDSVLSTKGWTNPRYEGCKLKAKHFLATVLPISPKPINATFLPTSVLPAGLYHIPFLTFSLIICVSLVSVKI